MSKIRAIIRGAFAVAVVGIFGVAAYAQDKAPTTPTPPTAGQPGTPGPGGFGGMRHGPRGGFGPMMGFRGLNLSDTQRQQMRDVFVKFAEGIKPQQQELRQIGEKFNQATATIEDQQRAQALRKQIHDSRDQAMATANALLTPDQQNQLNQMRQQMKQRHEEMKARRAARGGQDTPPPAQ